MSEVLGPDVMGSTGTHPEQEWTMNPLFFPMRIERSTAFTNIGSEELIANSRDFVAENKWKLTAAGILVGYPFASGLLQGLRPDESVFYGMERILGITAAAPLDAEFARKITADFNNGVLSPEFIKDLQATAAELDDSLRTIIFTAGGIALIVDRLGKRFRQGELRKSQILEGKSVLRAEGERILLLGGQGNHITDELLGPERAKHFIPVLESSAAGDALRERNPRLGKKPFYINLEVPEERGISYMKSEGWKNLQLRNENLIHSKNGHTYLMIVGVGMRPDMELSPDPEDVDVTHDDLRSANIRARENLREGDLTEGGRSIIDVYIGNSRIQRRDAMTGRTVSDAKMAEATGIDIYIDTWDVAFKSIAERLLAKGERRIAFAVSDPQVKTKFVNQWNAFVKRFDRYSGITVATAKQPRDGVMWITYAGKSENTFMEARKMRKRDPRIKILALVSTDLSGYAEAGRLKSDELVNMSEYTAKTVLAIEDRLRKGKTPPEIQMMVDDCSLIEAA